MSIFTESIFAALCAGLLTLVAELLHLRRSARLGRLSFGHAARPRCWTYATPLLRCACIGCMAWAMATLWSLDPRTHSAQELPESQLRRLVLLLDVSPSMQLQDAGPEAAQQRKERASDVIESLLERIALDQTRITVIAAYNGARRVVKDVRDLEVVRNILNDLPMRYAFESGKTRLDSAINEAAEMGKDWPKDSATLIIVSDGDTMPDEGLRSLPKAYACALVAGVGNPRMGQYIDGHQSLQNAAALRGIARRLRGEYYDVNQRHLPSSALLTLSRSLPLETDARFGLREIAMLTLLIAGSIMALLPVLLDLLGSPRNYKRVQRSAPHSGARVST